jgi:hypothetical protein
MNIEISNLELNKELDMKSKVATRGGIGAVGGLQALTVETTSAALRSNLNGCTAGTHSVCHVDGTDDADSGGIFGFALV